MKSNDYLTLIRTETPANKHVFLIKGEVVKKPGRPIYNGLAMTVRVRNVKELIALLDEVTESSDMVLCQGFVPGTEPAKGEDIGGAYCMMSQKAIREARELPVDAPVRGWHEVDGEPVIARLKSNMVPSSWMLIDRDYAHGIPEHLAGMPEKDWWRTLGTIVPGLDAARWVRVGSTSSRVLLDGVPLDDKGVHFWVQVKDPHDIGDFGQRLMLKAAAADLGFLKRNKAGVGTLWSIFDPTVFSHERIVYEGCPEVHGKRLSVREPEIEWQQGGRIDTSLVGPLTPAEVDRVKAQYGVIQRRSRGGGLSTIVDGLLTLDTMIETKLGRMSVLDFFMSGEEKVRCQATFRESDSWNGFLCLDYAGTPRLFDNGTRTFYELGMRDRAALTCIMFDVACNG